MMESHKNEKQSLLYKEWFFQCSTKERERGAALIQEISVSALKKLSVAERDRYGIRVLTMRRWPRGLSWQDIDFWLPSAGPSQELLTAWQVSLITWEEFLTQYRYEQQQQFAYIALSRKEDATEKLVAKGRSIDYLRFVEQEQGIVSVSCWEQDGHCHRYTLKQLVEEI